MRKISIMIAAMFVCVAFASIGVAEYNLEGNVYGEVNGFAGTVSPHVGITNQTATVSVDVTTDENTTMYFVNDSLMIDVNFTDETGRETFLLPRSIYYGIVITRSFSDAKLMKEEPWEDGLFKRLLPAKAYGAVHVVNSLLGEKGTNITIDLDYSIRNETYHSGENLTMHIVVMGFLPGDVNGATEEGIGRVVEYKTVNLHMDYI